MMRVDIARTLPIGPGRLVVVAGPSGAGKDTLLRFARNHLGGDPNIVFPHRVVTGSRRLRKTMKPCPKRTLLPQLRPAVSLSGGMPTD